MSKRILGKNEAIEQGKEISGGPAQPSRTILTWRGPKDKVLDKLSELGGAYLFNYKEDGPNAILTAEDPTLDGQNPENSIILDTWELLPGEAEKNLLEGDTSDINGLTKKQIEDIVFLLDNPPRENTTPDLPTGVVLDTYRLMRAGHKYKIVFAPVLRHTQTVSNLYTVSAGVSNVGRILKSSTLVDSVDGEGVPVGFLIALGNPPFSYSTKTISGLTFSYGWLKKYPTLNKASGSHLQIVQEWAFGLWPVLTYGAAI